MAELPTGTVTFLFTDIEGSTALWEQHPAAAQAALVRHDALVEEIVAGHKGHVVRPRGEGDSRFAVFARATDAVAAAAALQQAFYAESWPTPTPLLVRMAVHTGEADWREGDYYGSAVNRCARLRGVAHGGQILVSLATEQLVRDHLPPGTFLRDLGEGGLRGLRRAEHVFQLVIPDLPADFPPLKDFDPRYLEPAEGTTVQLHNPYQGLRAFHEADAPNFFGREALTQRLLARLGEMVPLSRFLAVVGPSGSGKSSVVRAGMLPALRRGALLGSDHWLIVELLPGAHPLEELEAVLLRIAVNPPASLLEQLRDDHRGLVRAVKRVLPDDETVELVLVIDQFEEVFTLIADEPTRVHFLTSLYTAVCDPRSRVRVIITLRADFYDRPLLYPDPGELMQQRTEVVLPLSAEELERSIVQPAARVGVTLEGELVATIITDVGAQPGALPLLQYALTELFERREGRLLTLAAYRASGGVDGALSRRAEEIYTGLTPPEQAAARQVFLRLVTLGEGVEDTRRRVRRSELTAIVDDEAAVEAVIAVYGQYRLLTFDQDPLTHGPTVEVAHEALLRIWPRLREWLEASRTHLRLERQLLAAASEWAANRQDASYLASGVRLAQFEALAQQGNIALTGEERAYLEASLVERRRREADDRRTAVRLRQRAIYLAVALVMALLATAAAGILARTAQTNFTMAERVRLGVQAQHALDSGESGDLPALLALRGLRLGYSPEADVALLGALERGFTRQYFIGHTSYIGGVAVAPDGQEVLTGSKDMTARLWAVQTGKEVRRFIGHTGPINGVAFSPDGDHVLTGSNDQTARLWDRRTGQEIRQFVGHSDQVLAVALSPDGTYVLTGSYDNSARLWETGSGREVRAFTGHAAAVNSVAFSPDGDFVLTGSDDQTARLWDARTGMEVRTFTGHTDTVTSVAYSPNGSFVLTGSWDNTARLWDAQTGAEWRKLTGHTDFVYSVAYAPDGRNVLTGSQDQTARLWDAASGREVHQFVGANVVLAVAYGPDSKSVLTGSRDYMVRLLDVESLGEPRRFAGHTGPIMDAVYSADGKTVLTGSDDTTARVWDVITGHAVRQMSGHHGDSVTAVAFSSDDKYVLTASLDQTARLWEVQTAQVNLLFAAPTGGRTWVAAYSPDGTEALTGNDDGIAYLWDTVTSKEVRRFIGHTGPVTGVAFSLDDQYVLTGSSDATARLWDRATGQEIRQFAGHTAEVSGVAFSPDGTYVVTGSWDQTVRLWEVETGKEVRRFSGHTDVVADVAFSPDGQYVATASWDQTARVWETRTGGQVRLFAHAAEVHSADFSPDGQTVLTGSADMIARAWQLDYHQVIGLACSKLTRDFTDEERSLYHITGTTPTCSQP